MVFLSARDLFSQFGQGLPGANAIIILVAASLTLLGAELTYRSVESVLRARGRVIAARVVANSQAG